MNKGFSLVEVLLASALFAILVPALIGGLIYGQQSTALAGSRARAVFLAEEGIEAVRNIRDAGFSNLTDGTWGLAVTGNQWTFSGSSDVTDIFTRQITISTPSSNRKQIISTVTWQQNAQRSGSVSQTTYLTNWSVVGSSTPTPTPTVTPIFTVTPTPTGVVNTCALYCASLGTYTIGTCRPNAVQCTNNSQTHQAGGDVYCTGGANADTCCCN